MSRHKVQTEMVTFRAPAGTKQDLDMRARAEGYKDRSALLLNMIGVSQETALSDGGTQGCNPGAGVSAPPPSESAYEGKDKLDRAHEAMARVSRPLMGHAHVANCPCSICTKSG